MAQMIYADPFGAAAAGQLRGIDTALRLGEAGRRFRDEDLNYDFRKWYDPFARSEAQAKAAAGVDAATQALAAGATRLGHYSGQYGRLNDILSQAYPGQFTAPQYVNPAQQQFGAETAFGLIDPLWTTGQNPHGHGYGYPMQGTASAPDMSFLDPTKGLPAEDTMPKQNTLANPVSLPTPQTNFLANPMGGVSAQAAQNRFLGTPIYKPSTNAAQMNIWDTNHPIGMAGGVQP